jgi:hypothetical protein
MEIGAQRTINKAGLVAGFAAPLCEPGDGSCESPSASEPRLVLVQLSDEDNSAPRISLFREPAARHRRSKLPCDDPLPRESSRSSVPVVDALLGGRGPRPAADCRGGKNQRREERDADTHSHMTHLHSNDGLLASSIGSGRWMGRQKATRPGARGLPGRLGVSFAAESDIWGLTAVGAPVVYRASARLPISTHMSAMAMSPTPSASGLCAYVIDYAVHGGDFCRMWLEQRAGLDGGYQC